MQKYCFLGGKPIKIKEISEVFVCRSVKNVLFCSLQ